MEHFDLIVIGGGPGGYSAALEAGGMGKKVALFECGQVGGTCLNRGCIPTKALLRASRLFHEAQTSSGLGISAQEVSYDMDAMHSHVDDVVAQLRDGIHLLLSRAGVTVVPVRAVIQAPGLVEAEGHKYSADAVIAASGSRPLIPPIPGHDLPGVLTSDTLLENSVDCQSLIIVGGGVVGVEFAEIYSRLGCKVTILEGQSRLLPNLDREIGQNLAMILKKRGIGVVTDAMVSSIDKPKGDYRDHKMMACNRLPSFQ